MIGSVKYIDRLSIPNIYKITFDWYSQKLAYVRLIRSIGLLSCKIICFELEVLSLAAILDEVKHIAIFRNSEVQQEWVSNMG